MEEMETGLQKTATSKRFVNYLIDVVIYLVLCVVISFFLGILLAISGNGGFVDSSAFETYANIFAFALLFLYYFAFETIFGATPGKFITGTRVRTRTGLKADAGTIALRTAIRFVPFEPFSFLFGEGWHDKWSKTMVVDHNP